MRVASFLRNSLWASLLLLMTFLMVTQVQTVFEAGGQGVKIWWDIVFPAVFPVLVLSEFMVGLGIVHFLGVLLEPIMRPLFRVPGAGGFAMAMGFLSSYPVGARLAALLRSQNLVTRAEGERLLCIASTADPMFILVAISVGVFRDATLGVVMAAAHFTGAILLGFLMRFHDPRGESSAPIQNVKKPLLLRAFHRMHEAQIEEKRRMMELLSDAVTNALKTVFGIGVFMIVFSVVIRFVSSGALSDVLTTPLSWMLAMLHLPDALAHSFVVGFLEVTQSMRSIADAVGPDMKSKIVVASAMVAWGGISVHMQVASLISSTDIRYQPYFVAKMLHAALAAMIAYFLWEPLRGAVVTTGAGIAVQPPVLQTGWMMVLGWNVGLVMVVMGGFFVVAGVVNVMSRFRFFTR